MSGRVLVTGGAGFIGSHVAEAFLAAGWGVGIVDNLVTGRRDNVPEGAAFFECDITDPRALEAAFSEFRPTLVNHHAAQTSVRFSTSDPAYDLQVNVLGTLRLIERAAAAGTRQFIFASSGGAIYGDDAPLPTPETAACRPTSPYGVSKLAAEKYLWWAQRTFGIACCALRYANVYGPRQDPRGEAGVIAIFAGRMLAGMPAVINDDGLQTRDYVYVGDIVEANVLAAGAGLSGAFNIGSGVETDVLAIHDAIARLTSFSEPRQHGPAMPGEQRRSCLDATRFGEATGWGPRYELERGLDLTVSSFAVRETGA